MFTIFSRIIHYGFKNFWRNGLLSTATVAIMVLALLVFTGLLIFDVAADRAVASIQDKLDIVVSFKKTTPEDEILRVKESLESLPEVKSVEYISTDKAIEIFKNSETFKNKPEISQAINELNTNPLEASLNIKARLPSQYSSIAKYLDAPNLQDSISWVSYAENQVVIDRLIAIVNTINRGGLVSTLFLTLIAGLAVFNTIRIAIYSNRDEVGIMRAVGASNFLVRGPLVVEGIIAGVLAAVASIIIIAPIVYFSSPYVQAFIPGFSIFQYFTGDIGRLFLYQLLFGVGIGVLSSFFAVRRYLKN